MKRRIVQVIEVHPNTIPTPAIVLADDGTIWRRDANTGFAWIRVDLPSLPGVAL